MKANITIDLAQFQSPKSRVFTGRDRGAQVRKDSKIDKLEEENELITVVIPDGLFSINPSFFEELFEHVVVKLGREKFFAKFSFENKSDFNFQIPLTEAIDRILRESSAIDN